ncbi:MAG: hypothetical protein AAF485_15385, partial [Chloroflexota bacterium]
GVETMSKSGTTVFVWGIYVLLLGSILVLIPNVLLRLFGFPPTDEVWIRVAGVLLLALGYYYVEAARKEYTDLFRWSVYARLGVMGFFILFVLFGLSQPILLLFGSIDVLGAAWTAWALRTA